MGVVFQGYASRVVGFPILAGFMADPRTRHRESTARIGTEADHSLRGPDYQPAVGKTIRRGGVESISSTSAIRDRFDRADPTSHPDQYPLRYRYWHREV